MNEQPNRKKRGGEKIERYIYEKTKNERESEKNE
jgi:hypothetical protein